MQYVPSGHRDPDQRRCGSNVNFPFPALTADIPTSLSNEQLLFGCFKLGTSEGEQRAVLSPPGSLSSRLAAMASAPVAIKLYKRSKDKITLVCVVLMSFCCRCGQPAQEEP